ncbi:MAG: hypothetical protein IT291_04585 [Deltaproteobacteria bacterium]|nr:hypothetical protein [Deltaproteobacteria bacterium]
MRKQKTLKEREQEAVVKDLAGIFESRGVTVRREKLVRGQSFRVKSGKCVFSGQNVIFVDKNLSLDNQKTVLVDHLLQAEFELREDELKVIPGDSRVFFN